MPKKELTNKTRRSRSRDIAQKQECYFCKLKEQPDFKEALKLRRFISDRGNIIAKSRTGTCSSHQRKVTQELKKARFLALVPYTERHAI